MQTEDLYTFEAQHGPDAQWLGSCLRWDNCMQAANAAGDYLKLCAENNFHQSAVRTVLVTELKLEP